MRILYIGAFPPDFLISKSKGRIDYLYQAHKAIIKGLRSKSNVELHVITSPDIASYPRCPLFINGEYNKEEDVTVVSSLNLPIVKQFWTVCSMVITACSIICMSRSPIIILIPYVVLRHVLTLRILHFLFPRKVVQACVVPDVFFPTGCINRNINALTERMASKFDGFIFYTEKMANRFNVSKDNYIVIEGFRDISFREATPSNNFRVVYAGTLNLSYGINRLVMAMKYISKKDIELHLYGLGDSEEMIRDACANDSRIVFHGRVSNKAASDAVYSASVLVNPRNDKDGEYTEYSFPSKNIEYMSSGIPTLLCKLPGMPEEYFGHFIDIEDGAPQKIASAIMDVYNMSLERRIEIGNDSRNFIIERMNCYHQADRICSLFHQIITNKYK